MVTSYPIRLHRVANVMIKVVNLIQDDHKSNPAEKLAAFACLFTIVVETCRGDASLRRSVADFCGIAENVLEAGKHQDDTKAEFMATFEYIRQELGAKASEQ